MHKLGHSQNLKPSTAKVSTVPSWRGKANVEPSEASRTLQLVQMPQAAAEALVCACSRQQTPHIGQGPSFGDASASTQFIAWAMPAMALNQQDTIHWARPKLWHCVARTPFIAQARAKTMALRQQAPLIGQGPSYGAGCKHAAITTNPSTASTAWRPPPLPPRPPLPTAPGPAVFHCGSSLGSRTPRSWRGRP